MSFQGIFCPATTPFAGDQIATDKFTQNLEKFIAAGMEGFVVLGSTGESVYLTHPEKLALIKTARAVLGKQRKLMVGTGCESTSETLAFTREAAKLGADCALVKTPYYYKNRMDAAALQHHFRQVADGSPIPVIIYNVPKFTGIDIAPEIVAELAGHANIIGIKDSTERIAKLTELLRLRSQNFEIYIGNAALLLPGLLLGADSAVLALCNLAPKPCLQIRRWQIEQKYDAARELFFALMPTAKMIVGEMGIAGIKAAMDLIGYFGGSPRSPLLAATETEKNRIKKILQEADLL